MSWFDLSVVFLSSLFVTTLFVTGLRTTTKDGYILAPIRLFLESLIGKFWSKPFLSCAPCMCSFWGSVVYWTVSILYLLTALPEPSYVYLVWYPLVDLNYLYIAVMWPFAIFAAVPLVVLIYRP